MKTYILVAVYLGAIVAANILVTMYGPNISILLAFLFIGLDLSTRDTLHDRWHGRRLPLRLGALIVAGSAISWLLNRDAGPIALASCAAFAASATVDTLAYTLLRDKAQLVRMNGSNALGALVDSLVFPALAFGLPLLWPIVLGQFLAKVGGGAVWSFVLASWGRRRDMNEQAA